MTVLSHAALVSDIDFDRLKNRAKSLRGVKID